MNRFLPFLACSAFLLSLSIEATTPDDSRPAGFTENRGQVINQNHNPNDAVKFIWAAAPGVNIQLRNTGISFDTYQQQAGGTEIAFHRLDMNFAGANPNPKINPGKMLPGHTNYRSPEHSIKGLKSYASVTYYNVYDGIDFQVNVTEKGLLKYDFIVRDATQIDDLKLEYAGFDTFEIKDGKLIFTLSGKTITEEIPASWMTASGRAVSVNYEVHQKTENRVVIGFSSDSNLSKNEGDLVIDPLAVREWATYYGDELYDKPEGIATDSLGNIFIVGTTRSIDRMASVDAYQNTFSGGNSDVFITRFNQHGLRQWATYYGGTGDDYGLDIDVDSYQRIFISGSTTSQDSIGSAGADQIQNGGGMDGFIAEFDRHGSFVWDSYIGGSGNEFATACYADNQGNVLVAGHTDTGGFLENDSLAPVLPYNAGTDAFMAKYDADGSRIWSSYFGGAGEDFASDIVVDSLKNWVMVGSTNSSNGLATGMAMQNEFGGETDGFAVKMDSTGSLNWATYLGGAGRDSISGVESVNGDFFFSGTTDSTLAYADTTAYQGSYGGSSDAFAASLNAYGEFNWFTYLGGAAYNEAGDISRDYAGDIYLSGSSLIDSTFNADTTGTIPLENNYEYFVTKFKPGGEHLYTGTFGGEKDDHCTAIAVYGYTSIYLTGTTLSQYNMVKDGPEQIAYQNSKDSTSLDGFIARLTQYISTPPISVGGGGGGGYAGSGSGGGGGNNNPGPPPIGICIGDSIQLYLNGGALGQGSQWVWYEGACGGTDNYIGEGDSIWVSPTTTTMYFVRSENVNRVSDCAFKTVHVDYPNTAIASANDSICPGDSLELFGEGGFYYDWSGPQEYTSDEQYPVIDTVEYNQAGIYTLIAETQFGCADTTTVDVFLLSPPNYEVAVTHIDCHGGNDGSISVTLGDTATVDFFWPQLATDTNTISNLSAGDYYLVASNYNGCTTGDSIAVNQPDPLIDSLTTSGAYCDHANGGAQVYISGSNPPFEVSWSPGGQSGEEVNNLLPGPHTVTVSDATGCIDSLSFTIANLGLFTTIIQPDSIFLEFGETTDIMVSTAPELDDATYAWSPEEGLSCVDCPNPTLNPDTTTLYSVVVTSQHECTSVDSVFVERALPEPNAFVPTVFSPNGDGLNDELCMMGVRIKEFELRIFDRSGNEIFTTTRLDNCWDGNSNGAPSVGTYIYTLQAVLEEGKTVNETGEINIQR